MLGSPSPFHWPGDTSASNSRGAIQTLVRATDTIRSCGFRHQLLGISLLCEARRRLPDMGRLHYKVAFRHHLAGIARLHKKAVFRHRLVLHLTDVAHLSPTRYKTGRLHNCMRVQNLQRESGSEHPLLMLVSVAAACLHPRARTTTPHRTSPRKPWISIRGAMVVRLEIGRAHV